MFYQTPEDVADREEVENLMSEINVNNNFLRQGHHN